MRSRAVRHAGRCIGLVALASVPATAHAQEARTSLFASTGLSVETNPYNAAGSSGSELAALAELHPAISLKTENTQIELRGLAQFRQFFRRYGLEDNYGADAQLVSKRSDRVTLRGSTSFAYSRGGGIGRPGLTAGDGIGSSLTEPVTLGSDGAAPTPGLETSLTLPTDATVLGQNTRLTSLSAVFGADFTLSGSSSLSADVNARTLHYQANAYQDYNTFGGELRYARAFNELLSIGVIGGYNRTNYIDARFGDAGVASALVSIDRKFGARWSASAALGASFANIDGRLGAPAVRYTSLTARLRFCRQGQFARLCLSGERSPQPAALGSVRVSDTIAADYSLRVAERQQFTLAGSYVRTGRGRNPLVNDPAVEYLSGSARYENNFSRRMSAFVSATVGKVSSPIAPRRTNVGGALGIQLRLGTAR